jgi:Xaa-Pro aminopeptidase
MKSDLDSLMQSHDIDALLVLGPGGHNPAMTYLTGGAFLTQAELIKMRGQRPMLFCRSMEREEAARTHLPMKVIDEYPLLVWQRESHGDMALATAKRWQRMFSELNLTAGRVAVYGVQDAGQVLAIFDAVRPLLPDIQFVGEMGRSLIKIAMSTKDAEEVERLRRIGHTAADVMGRTAEWVTGHNVFEETLLRPDGRPLTIGDVKRQIDLWLAEAGAENPEGTIFAQGHDAGVPHSTGNNAEPVRLGRTIVFDFFPREAGGGYFYDMTRTWSLGYATDEAQALYQNVWDVYHQVRQSLKFGMPYSHYQDLVCDLFEAQGHATIRSHPATTDGYVHSLGHGVGLHLHEEPFFRSGLPAEQVLESGIVITVEPGLYYPERGLGVRIEDTFWACPDGEFEPLAEMPYDFVLPMKS